MTALSWPFTDLRLVHLDRVDSTNLEAFRLIGEGSTSPCWILADQQTTGRGRLGRTWQSLPGNLFASLFFRHRCQPTHLPQLALVAALAVYDAIAQDTREPDMPVKLCLKWPNDLLLEGRKLAGVLIESRKAPGRGDEFDVVIGTGVNIVAAPTADTSIPAVALSQIGQTATRDKIFFNLVRSTSYWLDRWRQPNGLETIRHTWIERACYLDRLVAIDQGSRVLQGRLDMIDQNGALVLVDEDGARHSILSGHLMPIDAPPNTGYKR